MMDGGLVRGPGRTDRPTAARPEPARRQPAEPQAAPRQEPVAAPRPSTARREEPKPSLFTRIKLPLIIALIVIVVVAGGWFGWSKLQAGSLAIDDKKYQAIFFTNGQVYFGKLTAQGGDYLKLTDVYYLRSQQVAAEEDKGSGKDLQKTSTNDGTPELVKLGNEIHGPDDQMMISKDQVLFYENLKADGTVTKSINQAKKSNN